MVVRVFAPGAVDDPAGAPLTASDIVGAGLKASAAGLYALDTVDEINLLVIHPQAPDGSVDPIVVRAAEEYCRERHAVLLLDSRPRGPVRRTSSPLTRPVWMPSSAPRAPTSP